MAESLQSFFNGNRAGEFSHDYQSDANTIHQFVRAAGFAKLIHTDLSVDTSAYASGDLLGAKLTLSSAIRTSGGTGIIESIVLTDLAKQNAQIDVVFFDSNPSATTFTDNAALDIADADLEKIIGHVTIYASDYISFSDNAVATVRNLGLAFQASGSDDIYACLVVRGTPTYAADDLALRVTILQD